MRTDSYFDLIVVGAGTAGLSCAVTAADLGLRTAVVEQLPTIGGTLHRTGGMMSAAGTRRQMTKGIEDSVEGHFDDVVRIARRGFDPSLVRQAISGASETVDWLDDLGFRFHEDSPGIYYGHEPYSVPRTHWGEAAGESILEVLATRWHMHVAEGRIVPYLGHTLGELVSRSEVVEGVMVADQSTSTTRVLLSRATVLATGGFGSNREMYAEQSGYTSRPPSASLPGNTGEGHLAAVAAGAHIRRSKELLRLGRFPSRGDHSRVDLSVRADFEALVRQPREIWVNARGERFVNESSSVNTLQEHALLEQPGHVFWAVFDYTALTNGQSLVRGWVPNDYVTVADSGVPYLHHGATIDVLSERSGIDRVGLLRTVQDWNDGPDSIGRRIETGPFFALQCQGSILTTFSGLGVDETLRVRQASGGTFRNLFAVGEVLGAATTNGEAWVGGMCVTPALTLGRQVARRVQRGLVSCAGSSL